MFLADRVAVFSARPGTIKQVITVDEPHPRNPDFVTSAKFTELRNQLYALLHDEIRKAMRNRQRSERRRASTAPERRNDARRQAQRAPGAVSRGVQVGFLIVLLLLWYLATTHWGVSHLLLPKPVNVFWQFVDIDRAPASSSPICR